MRFTPFFAVQFLMFFGWAVLGSVVYGQALRTTGSPSGVGLNVSPNLLATPDRSVNFIVALVDNEPITNHDVRMAMQRLSTQAQQNGIAIKTENLANDALELLVFERTQLQWAEQSGIKISEEDMQSSAEQVAERNRMTPDEFYQALERQGVSKKRFLTNLREQQMLQRLRDRDVPARINITDSEIDRFLAQRSEEHTSELQSH